VSDGEGRLVAHGTVSLMVLQEPAEAPMPV
jgi:hypothetical protein